MLVGILALVVDCALAVAAAAAAAVAAVAAAIIAAVTVSFGAALANQQYRLLTGFAGSVGLLANTRKIGVDGRDVPFGQYLDVA